VNNFDLSNYPIRKYDNFHFSSRKRNAFEGFYFKVAKKDGTTLVIICGYAKSPEKSHAFIQVSSQFISTLYFEYPIDSLKMGTGRFEFSIGNNHFNTRGIKLTEKNCNVDLSISMFLPWKRTALKPSIMGQLSRIPLVECKHDVIAPSLEVSGNIEIENNNIRFDNDSGYIDKNWGSSFPRKYKWGHISGFDDPTVSIQFALGRPKWLGIPFPVYVGFFKIKDQIYIFNSLNQGKITMINIGHNELIMENKIFRIHAKFGQGHPLNLFAPSQGKLEDSIIENAGITTEVKVFQKNNLNKYQLIINETVNDATLEIRGEE
tara:strand:- start:9344 stop:10300 length:957 start_codon:yes stop_codon:yes gene_type:complete